jgi:hypothetical protein
VSAYLLLLTSRFVRIKEQRGQSEGTITNEERGALSERVDEVQQVSLLTFMESKHRVQSLTPDCPVDAFSFFPPMLPFAYLIRVQNKSRLEKVERASSLCCLERRDVTRRRLQSLSILIKVGEMDLSAQKDLVIKEETHDNE